MLTAPHRDENAPADLLGGGVLVGSASATDSAARARPSTTSMHIDMSCQTVTR
ncbi:hypothetical protein BTZ20_5077 [Rhodococcus sp. MTM3W5.2]|nr:hypothetical protein BTZ20_5077 [Rhodococcus sp. MTM3W5.2]